MNVLIMTDLEGISGIYSTDQVIPGERRFSEGRAFMTADINACARGLKRAGAERVYVRDCHGGSYTLLQDQISDDVDYVILGSTREERFLGLDDCGAVILLGYHAMAGTPSAILEHSMSSASIQNYWINGQKAGETAIDAGIAGDLGKPVIMVSGDDKVCAEARALIPGVYCAEVKKGVTSFGGMLLPLSKAHKLIEETAYEAYTNADKIKPVVYEKPIRFRVELVERHQLPYASTKPYMKIIDGRTYEIEADNMNDALFRA
ncbi:MAG: M55 family metallopeptidase [Clostridiales bacterium]|nr:M55 family metallopeptidase [Clostridiales bacterium]